MFEYSTSALTLSEAFTWRYAGEMWIWIGVLFFATFCVSLTILVITNNRDGILKQELFRSINYSVLLGIAGACLTAIIASISYTIITEGEIREQVVVNIEENFDVIDGSVTISTLSNDERDALDVRKNVFVRKATFQTEDSVYDQSMMLLYNETREIMMPVHKDDLADAPLVADSDLDKLREQESSTNE